MSIADPPTRASSTALAHALLDELSVWPFLRVERRGPRAVLRSGGSEREIGAIDLREGRLTVAVPRYLVGSLLARHPQLEPAERGVRIALSDDERCAVAQALLRWRLGRARFGAQGREASP
jgi:hypothetical protein